MSYTAMYRKFRPQRFEDVKGQDHIVTTLRNQIKSDRIGHAYLLCGTRGTGKTSIAKLFAKAINCEHPNGDNPCLECPSCRAIQNGSSMNVFEIDAASNNGVDNIRQIVEEVQYPPTEGKYKVYIIDEVHMLSIGAFNALLKTLEEPPSYVVFILATTEVHKLPVTILSRCQRYDFKRIGVDDIFGRIKELLSVEKLEAEDEAVRYIARMADGAMRDALSLLDQCLAFNYGKKLTYDMVLDVLGAVDNTVYSEIVRCVLAGDVSTTIKQLEKCIMEGRELSQLVTDLIWYLRNLMLAKTSDDYSVISEMPKEALERLKEEASLTSLDKIIRFIRVLSELSNQIRFSSNKRVLVEIALIKLCRPDMEKLEDSIVPRIEQLEDRLENGSFVSSLPAAEEKEVIPTAPAIREEAVPEDIKEVVRNWRNILGNVEGSEKAFLKDATPSLGNNGELLLEFTRSTCRDHFDSTDSTSERAKMNMEALKRVIADVSGKTVNIKTQLRSEASGNVAVFDLRSIFKGMEIQEEE